MAVPAVCVTHLELSSCLMAAVRVSSPSLSFPFFIAALLNLSSLLQLQPFSFFFAFSASFSSSASVFFFFSFSVHSLHHKHFAASATAAAAGAALALVLQSAAANPLTSSLRLSLSSHCLFDRFSLSFSIYQSAYLSISFYVCSICLPFLSYPFLSLVG